MGDFEILGQSDWKILDRLLKSMGRTLFAPASCPLASLFLLP
jgi:hypothetical protein